MCRLSAAVEPDHRLDRPAAPNPSAAGGADPIGNRALPGIVCGQITVPTGQLREIAIEADGIADSAKAYLKR